MIIIDTNMLNYFRIVEITWNSVFEVLDNMKFVTELEMDQ